MESLKELCSGQWIINEDRHRLVETWKDDDNTLHSRSWMLDSCFKRSGAGAASAAGERLNVIQSLPLLDTTLETDLLAAALIAAKAIPETEPRDAFHISIAATNGVKYLLTWNFKHIANATLRKRFESVCRNAGFEPPTICTPDELMGLTDDT